MRIVLISVYMGPAPFWFPAFLLSCRANPEVEWYLFTDMPTPPNRPNNVTFINMNLDSFNQQASEKLQMNIRVQPSFAYKIADLKSAFGKIFEDEIRAFDFWGHCDIDIVWGNIRAFVVQRILSQFDIITSRINRVSGHFCLFRNVPEITMTFQWIPNVAQMMQEHQYEIMSVDENCMTDYLHARLSPNLIARLKFFITSSPPVRPRVYWERVLATSGAHQRSMGEGESRCLWWRNGKTFDADGEEMMYLHFHKIKNTMHVINFGYADHPTEFMITRNGVFAPQ